MEIAFPKSLVLTVTASVRIPLGCLVCKRLCETSFLKMGARNLCLPSLPPVAAQCLQARGVHPLLGSREFQLSCA